MISVEITKPLGITMFDNAFPRNDFETKEQKKNADGVPMWSDPNETFEPFSPVSFEGFRIMTGENNGNTWVSFGADKMTKGNGNAAPVQNVKADK